MSLNPVNGQIIGDINEALEAVVDLKGEKIKFKRDEDVDNDLVYIGEGSDGKTYSIKLQRKNVMVNVYETPKPSPLKKASTTTKKEEDEKEKFKPTTT